MIKYTHYYLVAIYILTGLCYTSALETKSPQTIKEEAESIKGTVKLYKYLIGSNLISSDKLLNDFSEDYDENLLTEIGFTPQNLDIDIFRKNLFGDNKNEIVFQIRFKRSVDLEIDMYGISFFYQKNQRWNKVPGNITISQQDPYNQSCIENRCPGYFCFSYKQLRKENEFAIIGVINSGSCQGEDRGDSFYTIIWQITEARIYKLFSINNYTYFYSSPLPLPIRQSKTEIRFIKTGDKDYPKQISLLKYIYGYSFYDNLENECTPSKTNDCNRYQDNLIEKKESLVPLNFKEINKEK